MKAAALATAILCAASQNAGSAVGPMDINVPVKRPIACLVDSAMWPQNVAFPATIAAAWDNALVPRKCFSVMSDAEYTALRAVDKGVIGLGFYQVVPAPLDITAIHKIYDIRDTTLSDYAQWAFKVCWSRVDRMAEPSFVQRPCW